eukprot:291745_1
MSDFSAEKESLFFTKAILQLTSVFQWYGNKWSSYRNYINAIQYVIDIANSQIQWDRVNKMKCIIGHLLPNLGIECKMLPTYIKILLGYHMNNLPKIIEFDFRDLSHQYEWVQNIFVSQNMPNISNAFNLFPACYHIQIQMPDIDLFDDNCSRIIMDDATNIRNDKVMIEFV